MPVKIMYMFQLILCPSEFGFAFFFKSSNLYQHENFPKTTDCIIDNNKLKARKLFHFKMLYKPTQLYPDDPPFDQYI